MMKHFVYTLALMVLPMMAQADMLSDICGGAYRSTAMPEMTHMSDGEHYAMMEGDCILAYSYKTGAVTDTLFSASRTKLLKISDVEGYILSPDGRYMLVYNHSQRIFRHSFTADYYIYDRRRNELKVLSDTMPVQSPVFSPDGKYIAFTRQNNIYLHKLDYHTEVAVTTDGVVGEIYNGVTDWLYEEEFATTALYAFSPDSKQLAFVRLDERPVPTYSWQEYLDENGKGLHYPTIKSLRYPKAGDSNPVASLCVYDTYYKSVKTIDLPEQKDSYLPRLRWTNSTEKNPVGDIVVLRMNRDQDRMEVFTASPKSTLSTLLYKEESNKYWVDYSNFDMWQWLSDNSFVCVNETSGYRHAYLYSSQGQQRQQLTKGNWDVTEVYGYDEKLQTLYYQAADKDPMTRYIYALGIKKQTLTSLAAEEGMHNAVFSANLSYFVDNYQSVSTPARYTLCDRTGKVLRVLHNNDAIAEKASKAGLPTKQFFSFTTSRGDQLNGWMLMPRNFDASKKYPVLMMQYSGPGSQQVLNRWRIDWEEYLAAERDVICICVDGRGTDARGRAFRGETYRKLGHKEAEDQVDAARYMASLPYVDAARIAIWGWSYGGYQTLMSMSICGINPALGKSPFCCGIAVAPVTDWRLYDSAYTERYMRRPQVNDAGYTESSLLPVAKHLQGRVLIAHGLADDNVHVQNAFLYTEALVAEEKQFEEQIYPDDNHFLRKRSNYRHLYRRMLNFLDTNLQLNK